MRSLTIAYFWEKYFDKGSMMLLKLIKRYLETDLSLGKPVPFEKINILIKDAEIYERMTSAFTDVMFKIDE